MLKKYLKNSKGFTLVEVIVVAVIVAVLAGVAVLSYNGYIKDSRKNMAANTAGSIASLFGAGKAQGLLTDANVSNATSGTVSVAGATDKQVAIPTGFTCTPTGNAAGGNISCYYTSDGTGYASSSYSW
jgi:prepilin-type N-terminal cleavage/methylation domain-containing protein